MDKSEIIREWIRGQFAENHDFSNRDNTKQKFIDHFESDENKASGITWARHSTLFIKQLKKICKEKQIDPTTYGYARERVDFKPIRSDNVNVKITPKPKGSQQTPTATAQQPTVQGATVQQQGQPVRTPMSDDEAKPLTKIVISTGGNLMAKGIKGFENFSEEQKDTLALVWNPILKPYFERAEAKWVLALGTTAGIIAQNLKKSDDKEKSDTKKSDKPDNTNSQNSPEFEQWKKDHGM